MGECLVSIPMSEYRKMVGTETRVKMMLDYMAHHEQRINSEDIYLFLGMPEDAEMVKEEREKLLERYQELTVKGIEVIGA
jgi:hypothetical protein